MGLFSDSKRAGDAVAQLKERGYTDDISVLAKDDKTGDPRSEDVKKEVKDSAAIGAGVGAVAGAIWAGLSAVALPGLGLLVGGPLAALLTGGGAGALAGGLAGALADYGIPKDMAKKYEERIGRGDVAVAVTTDEGHVDEVRQILSDHSANEIQSVEK